MKMDLKRKISAWMLLAVYLPLLILSSIHLHTAYEWELDECYQCASHLPHSGHITSQGATHHVCLLCQFLSLPGLIEQSVMLSVCLLAVGYLFVSQDASIVSTLLDAIRSRAPPFFVM